MQLSFRTGLIRHFVALGIVLEPVPQCMPIQSVLSQPWKEVSATMSPGLRGYSFDTLAQTGSPVSTVFTPSELHLPHHLRAAASGLPAAARRQ